jgi:hypothetical protein
MKPIKKLNNTFTEERSLWRKEGVELEWLTAAINY